MMRTLANFNFRGDPYLIKVLAFQELRSWIKLYNTYQD